MDQRSLTSRLNGLRGGRPISHSSEQFRLAKYLYLAGHSLNFISQKTKISLSHLYRLKNDWHVRTIRVAINFEPFDTGHQMGVADYCDQQLIYAICANLGYRPKLIYQPFHQLLKVVELGVAELAIANLSAADFRRKTNLFSVPYDTQHRDDISFFVASDSPHSHLNQIFKGRIGVTRSSMHDHFLQKQNSIATRTFANEKLMVDALIQRQIDGLLSDTGSLPVSSLGKLRAISSGFNLNYGLKPSIAFNLREDRLGAEFNVAIERLNGLGFIDELLEKSSSNERRH